jgi:phage baseplate assembly protein W
MRKLPQRDEWLETPDSLAQDVSIILRTHLGRKTIRS